MINKIEIYKTYSNTLEISKKNILILNILNITLKESMRHNHKLSKYLTLINETYLKL